MPKQNAPTVPARRYRWGRLFIRSATICALVSLTAGLGVVGLQLVLLRQALATAGSRSEAEFSGDLAALRSSCRRTAEIVQTGFGAGAVPAPPAAAFPDAIRTLRDIDTARTALAAYEDFVAQLKAGMLTGFTESADWLVGSLTRKAERIRQQIQEEHSTEAAKLQAHIDGLRQQLEGGDKGLYQLIDQAEFQRRNDILDQSVEFMQFLGTMGGGEAVQARVDAAVQALGRLRSVVPEPSPEGRRLRLVQQVADARRALSDLVKDGHKLEGEELAERLRVLRREVVAAVQSSWAVDADLERRRRRLDAAAATLAAVEQERSRLLNWALFRSAAALAGAVGVAFLLLVLADTLSALFDAAEALPVCQPGAGDVERDKPLPTSSPAPDPPASPGPKLRRYLQE